MIKHSFGSLRFRLIVLVLFAIVPAFALLLFSGVEYRRQMAVDVRGTALDLAQRAAGDQQALVEGSRQLMVALAQLSEVRAGDAAGCTKVFGDILKQYPRYVNLIAVHTNGDVFCSAVPRVGKPVNIADRQWLQRTLASGGFTVGEYEVGKITGQAEVHVGYPVIDGAGRVQGVVSAGLNLEWLNQLAAGVRLPGNSSLTITDRQGTVLARYPSPEQWVGNSIADTEFFKAISIDQAGATEITAAGVSYLQASTPLYAGSEARNLLLSIVIPSSVAYAEADSVLARNLALLALVAIAALLAAWFGADLFILRQVRALVRATRRLSAGDLDARTGLGYGIGELSQLARSFDQMVGALGERETERNKATDELRRYQGHLEELVQERTSQLEQATREAVDARALAEAATRAKSDFLANMSHELRTPMNAIIGYSEMLIEEAQDSGQLEHISDLEKIQGAGKHLLQLINDILDLSKIEADKLELHLETFSLESAIKDVLSTIQPLVAKNANSLSVHFSPDLGDMYADITRVRQVLFNLLSNASKFTSNGTIRLDAVRAPVNGTDWITLSVRDSGIGMTAEQMEKLFQKFSQADSSTTRKYGGTGLGLAISKRFCEMMGGDIAVESVPGEGSVFTVTLPAEVRQRKQEPQRASDTSAVPSADGRITVLVIDDDATIHDLLSRFLAKEGFRAVTALGGDEGLRLAREVKPDAITLDVLMPGMDGWATLSALKADPALADIPVIMLSIVDEKNLGFALGASDYMTKPIDRERLVTILRKHARRQSTEPILVVDDDPAARELLTRTLESDGWAVVTAEDGRLALTRVAENRPALILLDLLMPNMDGFEFVAELRKREDWQSIPIVVVTAKDLTADDHARLSGSVKKILAKGTSTREDMLRQLHELMHRQVANKGGSNKELVSAEDSVR